MDLDTRMWLQERIDGRLAAGVAVAWLLAYELAAALEPVTHRPEPWYGVALGVAFLGLVAATATGLVMQRRWGLVLSVAAAGFFTALSVACPVSGHHPFGAWWFGQMACALGMLGGSVAALSWSVRTDATATAPEIDAEDPSDVTDAPLVSAGDAASQG
jgi:MFS family permease